MVSRSVTDTVVMFRWPVVGWTGGPSISTTVVPPTVPSVS
jgi:hypothetical protein